MRSPTLPLLAIVSMLASNFALAALPDGTSLTVNANPATSVGQVVLAEPGDHAWLLQSSPNLADWTTVETIKVHNGTFRRNISLGGSGTAFYRTIYDASIQGANGSAVANALLLPATPFNYATPTLLASFAVNPIRQADTSTAANRTTDTGAKLGRVLFYDKRLSANQTIACASCHQQKYGFSDPKKFSTGFQGGLTGRNSMGLTNARWYARKSFFWDERAATLEDQVLMPIQNTVEMGMTLPDLVSRLSNEPFYQSLFTEVFGSPDVTSTRISFALAQFVRSIASTQTKYDAGVATNFANFTAQEELGRQIFTTPTLGNCVACHGTDNFMPGGAANNNGLEFPYVDKGIGGITGVTADEGKFKVGSLRNIELTGPYMHDGRFATLEEVVEFYNSGVVQGTNLSGPLRNPPGVGAPGSPRRLNLTTQQKAALVAFLKTLTDTTITTDTRWSDPFNYGNN